MNKFALLIALLALAQPALALDVNHPDKPSSTEEISTKTKGAAGAVIGFAVGLPVRIIQCMHHDSKVAVAQLKQEFAPTGGGCAATMAAVVGVPYGVAFGAVHGVMKSPEGLHKGYEWPFSYDSIGFDEDSKAVDSKTENSNTENSKPN